MKSVSALDYTKSGRISALKFKRVADPDVYRAAEVQVKAQKMWKEAKLEGVKGVIDRLKAWAFILQDNELQTIMGRGNQAHGLS